MNRTQHTPAPWKVNYKIGYPTFTSGSINDVYGRTIAAILPSQKRPPQERAANANMIAAAPEMYDKGVYLLAVVAQFKDGECSGVELDAAVRDFDAALVKARWGAA